MALRRVRVGALEDVFQYDDGDFSEAVETDQPIKIGASAAGDNAVRQDELPTLANIPSAAAVIGDHKVVRGDGGARGIQDSGVEIDDSDNMSVPGRVTKQGTFAEIYVADGAVAQTIPTGAAYTKITAFTSNGQNSNCTPDQANDKITVTKTGRYKVTGSFTGYIDIANTQVDGAIFLDGNIQDNIKCYAEFVAANKYCSASISGIIDVDSINEDLDFRVRHDDPGNVNITIVNANLNVIYLGET